MPSYTTSLRFTLQDTGSNLNVWGNVLNTGVFALVDTAIAGRYSTTAASVALTSNPGAADTSRNAILDVTGGSGTTFTAPAVTKLYFVRNGSSGDVVVTTGGATNATVKAGERVPVFSDGTNFYRFRLLDMGGDQLSNLATPTTNNAAATKAYVDAIAFQTTGALPGINVGTAGQYVSNDGINAYWFDVLPARNAASTGKVLKSLGNDDEATLSTSWDWDGWRGRVARPGAFSLALTDRAIINLCSGTFTVGIASAATLGSVYYTRVINAGTGLITIDPTGAETVTMAGQAAKATIVLIPGEGVDLFSDGTSDFLGIVSLAAGPGPHLYAYETLPPAYADSVWITRPVSTLATNLIGAVYSAGAITGVPPGRWKGELHVDGYGTSGLSGRIYNNTTAAEVFHSEICDVTAFNPSTVVFGFAEGRQQFDLTATSSLSLQSYGGNTAAAGGSWGPSTSPAPFDKRSALWLTRISP